MYAKSCMFVAALLSLTGMVDLAGGAPRFASHPPIRALATPSQRPKGEGPAKFVDPVRGDDAHDGSQAKPWKTINHALAQISPGDTLYLRGGTYFENVYCAVAGEPERPITIRSYPGELATIDGGMARFQTDPAAAWEPAPDGAAGEYRSTAVFKNIRDVVGLFGDSNVGLQTYWYRMDLQADNELWIRDPATFVQPVYCGPGLWYDKLTGRIHVRLAHTKLTLPDTVDHQLVHYQGETDPRKLPLVIAAYDSTPLHVAQAKHVKFQDLVIRGGGHATVKLMMGIDVTLDRCTIYAGNYGVWSKGTGPLTMVDCGVYGMMAPWMFRDENSSYAYSAKVYPPFLEGESQTEIAGSTKIQPKQIVRHIARLPTHAILVTEGGYEFETFYYPHNHDWNVHHCEFTDGHDGVYPSGRDIDFHHNLVDNVQDDAVYISSPTPYISDGVYLHENLIRRCWMAFGGHARGGPGGKIHIYRNVVDMRHDVHFSRPSPQRPTGLIAPGATAFMVHNSDHIIHIENIYFYHNTSLLPQTHSISSYNAGMSSHFHPAAERRVFNNLCVFVAGAPRYPVPMGFKRDAANLVVDGNLHWHADPEVKVPADPAAYFKTSRMHPLSDANKDHYPDGWDAHSIVGDPRFAAFSLDRRQQVDLRLRPDSPAIKAGVPLPTDWPDPYRPADGTRPEIGALPLGCEPLRVGVAGRFVAGQAD